MANKTTINPLDGLEISSARPDIFNSAKKVTFNTPSANDYMTNEAYKTLRTNLLFCGNHIKTILVTSCEENEGKSTVSTELTKSLAESGKRTLLIDADLRKSVMLRSSNRTSDIEGLSEALSGICEPEDVIYKTQHPNFDVIFSGHFPPNPVELLGNNRLQEMLDHFKKTYDYIIIDSPPLNLVIDAAVIAACCDGAMLIINDGRISRSTAINVKQQLEKSNCQLLGVVLNNTEKKTSYLYNRYYKRSSYYRGYSYGYGHTYGYEKKK